MTVQVDPGPSSTDWTTTAKDFLFAGQTSKWTVSVAGQSAFVYGYERTSQIPCLRWANAGDSGEDAFTSFGTDDAVSTLVTVARAGGFTSAKVYPESSVVSWSLSGGTLTMQLKAGRHVIVEANGSRQHVLRISSSPLREAIPGGYVNWTAYGPRTASSVTFGTNRITFGSAHGLSADWKVKAFSTGTLPTAVGGNIDNDTHYFVRVVDATNIELARTSGGAAIDLTSNGTGTLTIYRSEFTSGVLYFPAGIHRIGRLFDLSDDVQLYLDHGAVVVGSLDLRGCDGVEIMGLGILQPSTHSSEDVLAITSFYEQIEYAGMLAWDGAKYTHDNEVRDITMAAYPFYSTFYGVNRWLRTKLHSPWNWSADGYKFSYKSTSDLSCSCVDVFGQVGDDGLYLTDWFANVTFTRGFLTTTQNSVIIHGYWPNPYFANAAVIEDSTFMHYGIVDTETDGEFPARGTNCVFKSWVDGATSEEGEGSYNCVLTDCEVVGPVASRVFSIANRLHPFSAADLDDLRRDGLGEISGIVIDGLTVEEEPGQLSMMEGWDFDNTPHDIEISRWRVAGVLVTPQNWPDYVTQNAYAYRITLGGKPVVTVTDICNRALSLIGQRAEVTSIAPPDGSAEALHCLAHYDASVNELLELHDWDFATKRVALVAYDESDDASFAFSYEPPEGYIKVLAVLPETARVSQVIAGEIQPPPFEKHLDSDGETRIYTDLEDAYCLHTAYITTPGSFSPLFLEALYWKLAAKLAGPIIKGSEGGNERDRCLGMLAVVMARATATDSNQQRRDTRDATRAPWHRMRIRS